ncbi:(2Fe-2S) ferredoxin domain-containing protein [Algoriphagus lutimaris]|uniref:(2Fe-2S) ferredoxin domain-containing protein n=1 Tax=Algoriphagus lutimaris TaxID=613197 RepID=UPI00196B125A|nr:(2Fe-2S) ferredoxin domain-containing protein [Algoriphagus lutimaris]MBN3519612.1 (2Fe-2S) ferredoxin domain-containing protein [Algoriphagus lutimaris]
MESKRKLVFVCGGSDCKKAGSKILNKEIARELKSSELKGQCKLIKTKCMDFCKSAPVVIVGEFVCKKANLEKVTQQLKKS